MRVCLIHRYFWPDTPPYASILRSIAGRLASDGHDVTVFSTQPSYNASEDLPPQPRRQTMDGFRVVRCRLPGEARRSTISRLLDMLLFSARAFWHLLRGRYDVVMAASIPPVALATASRFAARLTRARFVYHDMDIYPEAALLSGLMRQGILYRMLRALDTHNCHGATAVVVLSKDMAATIADRGLPRERIRILNNFDLDDFADDQPSLPAHLRRSDDALRVAFAGNIGQFQSLEAVIDAAHELESHVNVRVELLGDGLARPSLEERAGRLLGSRIQFHGHQPLRIARAFVESADLALITLAPGLHQVAFPSKTMTYLACATPLLTVVQPHSELAHLIQSESVGFAIAPEDTVAIANLIEWIAANRDVLAPMRARALRLFEAKFSRSSALQEWSHFFTTLESSSLCL